ncbi:hypothetical protein B0H14DRAFT_2566582 [Mycena olivaceomarginata]|nr:hypothetical protein B0H14DRAFT_2566582 [Mycena olivaceomarginata]
MPTFGSASSVDYEPIGASFPSDISLSGGPSEHESHPGGEISSLLIYHYIHSDLGAAPKGGTPPEGIYPQIAVFPYLTPEGWPGNYGFGVAEVPRSGAPLQAGEPRRGRGSEAAGGKKRSVGKWKRGKPTSSWRHSGLAVKEA